MGNINERKYAMVNQKNILIVSGPSGVGKTTVVKVLMEQHPELKEEVSCTSRPRRPGETDGVEYHFISREEFERRLAAGYFFESSEYNGNLYGTLYSELEEKTNNGNLCVTILDIPGARELKAAFPDAFAVFLHAPPSVLEKRLRRRGTESEETIQKRLESAGKEMILGVMHEEIYPLRVLSDDRNDNAEEIWSRFSAHRAQAGIRLAMHNLELLDELAAYKETGLTPEQVLKLAGVSSPQL